MSHTHTPTRLHRAAGAALAAAALAAGLLASTGAMATPTGFDQRMHAMTQQVNADPNYRKLPLDNKVDREWFYYQTEALYAHKITKDQFVSEGGKRFPGYEASLSEIADAMTK
jgi:hypothetical protein